MYEAQPHNIRNYCCAVSSMIRTHIIVLLCYVPPFSHRVIGDWLKVHCTPPTMVVTEVPCATLPILGLFLTSRKGWQRFNKLCGVDQAVNNGLKYLVPMRGVVLGASMSSQCTLSGHCPNCQSDEKIL